MRLAIIVCDSCLNRGGGRLAAWVAKVKEAEREAKEQGMDKSITRLLSVLAIVSGCGILAAADCDSLREPFSGRPHASALPNGPAAPQPLAEGRLLSDRDFSARLKPAIAVLPAFSLQSCADHCADSSAMQECGGVCSWSI